MPIGLGADSKGLCGLSTVCKSFQLALKAIPLHVTASPIHLADILSQGWDITAVQLRMPAGGTSALLIEAASALPDRAREKIVTVEVPGATVASLASGLRQLEGVRHMIINGGTTHLDCLSHLERLDLTRQTVSDDLLVLMLPRMHAACSLLSPMMQEGITACSVQEIIVVFPKLHTLHISGETDGYLHGIFGAAASPYRLSFHTVAQCPALRVLELSNGVFLKSPGTFEEAVEELEGSSLQLMNIHWLEHDNVKPVVRTQANTLLPMC